MNQTQQHPNLAEYLTISEAAEFLGISTWTLRNWDKDGKLKTLRHPKNGYRMYRHEDLEEVLQSQTLHGPHGHRLVPEFDAAHAGDTEHFVQFYESDAFLVRSVSRYVGAALAAGDGAVIIATPAHRSAIRRKLRAQGLDLSEARAQGQFISLDAEETLATFMIDGSPDPGRFAEVIGGVIAGLAMGRSRVRAFGEMVALLWSAGKRDAAIRLEELWNDLQKKFKFALYCAYPIHGFGGENHDTPFQDICTCHSRVLPAESYADLGTETDRLQAIARLQQKAQTLEAEITHRKEVEARLRALQDQQQAELVELKRLQETNARLYRQAEEEIAERKRAEAALQEADRRKDEFLALLAHELRNPLAPLQNALQILRRAANNPVVAGEARALMERQLAQMVRLIDDLLDVSRITRNKLELRKARVDLAAVVRVAVETSHTLIEANQHHLTLQLPDEPILLDADRTRLAQVFANLLNNAAKYTEPGGQISLRAGREDGTVVVRVKDNGHGIPADMLTRIFDMFTQVDRSLERRQGGLGIGLTLVKRLVEMHGGRIEVQSDGPGQGSEFVVRLPALTVPADGESKKAHGESAKPAPAIYRRILVADDNQDAAASLGAVLRLMGAEVHTVADGRAAVEAAKTFRPEVVLLDIGMPRLNGYDAARHIREQPWGKDMVLIALTGWGQSEDRRRTREAGFDHHLLKPVDAEALQRLLAGMPAN